MSDDLRLLRRQSFERPSDFAPHWSAALARGDIVAREVDAARRRVSHYFQRVHRIYKRGFATKKWLRAAAEVDGLNVLFDVVRPLELALNPKADVAAFDDLRRLCGRPGTGHLMTPVQPAPAGQAGA